MSIKTHKIRICELLASAIPQPGRIWIVSMTQTVIFTIGLKPFWHSRSGDSVNAIAIDAVGLRLVDRMCLVRRFDEFGNFPGGIALHRYAQPSKCVMSFANSRQRSARFRYQWIRAASTIKFTARQFGTTCGHRNGDAHKLKLYKRDASLRVVSRFIVATHSKNLQLNRHGAERACNNSTRIKLKDSEQKLENIISYYVSHYKNA